MSDRQRFKAMVVSTLVRDIPKAFWDDARTKTRQTYMDSFHGVHADPNIIAQQKLDKLYQERHFRMEHTLMTLAQDHGMSFSPTLIGDNGRYYAYATRGVVAMTQAYAPAIGIMPKPARYRERYAAINDALTEPRLPLDDEPQNAVVGKSFYGVVVHNPVGKRFVEDEQKLGMLQFCVPVTDCSDWATQLTIEEIVSAYPEAASSSQVARKPSWKKIDRKKGDAR